MKQLLLLLMMAQAIFALTPSAPLTYINCKDLVVQGKSFTSGTNGIALRLVNCQNVLIENNSFDLNGNVIAIQIEGGKNIRIRHNQFRMFRTGVYAIQTTGGIDIQCNQFEDIAGSKPRGQMVQFNKGSGSGNRVNYNTLDHTPGIGNPEDLINMYGSGGTSADPIQIIGNQLRGGGPSTSGGGIMVGDDGGHDIRVEDNILVDPGQYGIGSPAGSHITLKNNTIYGKQQSFTNVGLYVGLKTEIDAGFVCDGPSILVEGNRVNFINKNGVQNDFYYYPGCPNVVKTANFSKAPINSNILPATLTLNLTLCEVSSSSSSSISVSSSSSATSSSSMAPVQLHYDSNSNKFKHPSKSFDLLGRKE